MTKAEKDVDLLSFVGIVRKKLSGEGSGPPSGAPPAVPPAGPPAAFSNSTNFGQLRKLLAPLYDDDKIVRNAIKLAKKWSKGGKGGP